VFDTCFNYQLGRYKSSLPTGSAAGLAIKPVIYTIVYFNGQLLTETLKIKAYQAIKPYIGIAAC